MNRKFALVAVLVAAVAGCGGADAPNFAEAAERTEGQGSMRFVVRTYSSEAKNQWFECFGGADFARKRVQLSCGATWDEFIAIEDTLYVRTDELGVANWHDWVKIPLSEAGRRSIRDLSPQRLLQPLRAANVEIERIGKEEKQIGPTVRYRLTVTCEQGELGCLDRTSPVDVWLDEEGLIRQIELKDDGKPAMIEFYDFGVDVDIQPPPADEVKSLTELENPT